MNSTEENSTQLELNISRCLRMSMHWNVCSICSTLSCTRYSMVGMLCMLLNAIQRSLSTTQIGWDLFWLDACMISCLLSFSPLQAIIINLLFCLIARKNEIKVCYFPAKLFTTYTPCNRSTIELKQFFCLNQILSLNLTFKIVMKMKCLKFNSCFIVDCLLAHTVNDI